MSSVHSNDEPLHTALPELSPYLDGNRYTRFKEDHKNIVRKLSEFFDPSQPVSLVDVGCGNGELLFVIKNAFSHWELQGSDATPEYIEVARQFEGLAGVNFSCESLFDLSGVFDVVVSTGLVEIFQHSEPVVKKLIDLCKPGGWMISDGIFNPYPVDVRLQFCDKSKEEGRETWRTDWNMHSQQTLRELLEGHVASIEFEEVIMDMDLPFDPSKPAFATFTFRDADGKNIQTNGLNIIKNKHLMIVRK